jgi:uncharacterized protein involved in outer membrane biogenesis
MTTRARRWIAGSAAALVVAFAALWALLLAWLPSDEQLAARTAEHFEQTFGIGLRVGGAHWSIRPVPVIVLSELATEQPQPITARRIALHPRLAALWRRELALDSIEIEGAVLPRASVRAFRDRAEPEALARKGMAGWTPAAVPLEHLRFRDLTWIDRRQIALAYDGDIEFDARWRPRKGEIRRAGTAPPARLRFEREDATAERWRVLIDVAGGSWNGVAALEALADDRLRLTGKLDADKVDIEGLMHAFGRGTPVAGKLAGSTELHAEGRDAAELVRSLRTRTRFTVRPAELTRFDLANAVRSAGTSRGGRTPLDELTGTLDTQATDEGVVLRYRELKARSGLLTATGSVRLFNRKLDGEAAVDLVDGVVGVPLKVSGTVEQPELSLTGGALAGAAVGSAVLPGVGTAIGARLGQRLEELFGSDDAKAKKSASAKRRAPPAR